MFLHWVLDPEFWGVFDTNKNFTQTSQQTSQHTSRTTSHATSQRIRMLNFIFPMPGSLQGRMCVGSLVVHLGVLSPFRKAVAILVQAAEA